MELFQVTLKRGEDIDAFYDDMETPGGALHIPDRKVECTHRRPTSRTTGYMLTMEEAQEVAADDRVEQVVPQSILDQRVFLKESTFTGRFDKSIIATGTTSFTKSDNSVGIRYTVDHKNWGLLRHIETANRSGWGSDAASSSDRYVDTSVTYSASGKNVDIVIVELHTHSDHEDISSRLVDYNWGQHYNTITGGTNYTYSHADARTYPDVEDSHTTAVASFAAGTLYGVANDANIYVFDQAYEKIASGGDTTDRTFEYIREFHRTKPINSATGRKNPTIVNLSLGSYLNMSGASFGHFQGVDNDKGDGSTFLSEAELIAMGIHTSDSNYNSNTDFRINYATIDSDQEDAIDEGIIVVTSAGNDNRYIDESGGDNYDNYIVGGGAEYTNRNYEFPFGSGIFPFRYYYNRGDQYARSGAINVGSLSNHTDQGKATFSGWGPGVDVYAAGESMMGASWKNEIAYGIPYPGQESNVGTWDTIGFGQGTSYSAPYVAGLLACLAEVYPTLTQAQARTYLRDNAVTGLMQDTGSSTTDWSPTDAEITANATTAAWFDASDTSSYTLSGSNVTAVTDKKGNATVTVNGTPNVSNTLDGKNVWTFVPDEDFTTDEFAQVDSNGNHWAIGLMQWNTRNDAQDSFWSTECNTQTPKRDYAISAGASNFDGELDLDGLSSNRISSTIGNKQDFDSGIAQNTWVIICAIFNKTGNQIAVRLNGADAFTPVNDYDNALNTNMDLRFFRNRANERMGGRMAEFLTFAGLPGTGGTDVSHVERIEGYLAHKWGQASSLPVSHPYYSSAPLQNGILVDSNTRVSVDGSDIDRIVLWKNHRQTSGNMAFNTYNKDVNNRPTSGLMYPRVRTRRRG
jgi:hypothetical protein